MAEVKNNFIKSRMNKDLDARLVPPGEYRNAQMCALLPWGPTSSEVRGQMREVKR